MSPALLTARPPQPVLSQAPAAAAIVEELALDWFSSNKCNVIDYCHHGKKHIGEKQKLHTGKS